MAEYDPFDVFALALFTVLIVIVLLTFHDYAISNDEEVQQRYGELIIDFYVSGFTNQTLFHFKNLFLYGGLFDITATLVSRAIPADIYLIRHMLCAVIGVAGIAAAWATARFINGPRAGAIAAASLAVCGVWYGGMFNHTKDIPFAAAMMGATFFFVRASRDFPRPRWRDVVLFGLLLGCALGQRATGLIFIGYIGLFIVTRAMQYPGALPERMNFIFRTAFAITPAFVIAYVIMVAAWPWAALHPLNPIRAIFAFAHFHYPIRTLLAGHIYEMADVPRWYVPTYLVIKLPIVALIGAALSVLATIFPSNTRHAQWIDGRRLETGLLIFMVILPVLCQVAAQGPAFTGMRHFLFVVPLLAALAGIGFDTLLTVLKARRQTIATVAFAALGATLIWDASILVRLHPDQYLFYNSLVGGLEGASRRYATDYWVNIMPEAVIKLETFLARTDGITRASLGQQRYTVAVCGERLAFEKQADLQLKWTDDWDRADFFIAPTHMNCDAALGGKVVAVIERLGVPIGVIKDRRAITRPDIAAHGFLP